MNKKVTTKTTQNLTMDMKTMITPIRKQIIKE
jgi:hypothetical protein